MSKYNVSINFDDSPENPRDFENQTIMVFYHRRYHVPNEAKFNFDDYNSLDEAERGLKRSLKKVRFISRVYMYDHGGTAYSLTPFSCRFDSGCLGFIVITADSLFDKKRRSQKQYEEIAKSELKMYSNFVNGEVYCVTIKDENGDVVTGCSGYYDKEEAEGSAKDMIEHLTKK